MEYVLGIDIGTGSVKAVAVSLKGVPLRVCQSHYSFVSPRPGYHEQDPPQIWNAFRTALKEIIQLIGAPPLAVGLSSAMHSLIPVNEDGEPLAPMTTWADNRSAGVAKSLMASEDGLKIYRDTGTPIHPMSPLCKIIWMRENDPLLFKSTYKFISIKEYIWHKLFQEFKIDHSVASGTGLFNIHELTWNQDSLILAGITARQLSEPVTTSYTKLYKPSISEAELNFPEAGIPFTIAGSDGCLANLGSMANKPGIAAMTIGTSGAVRVTSPQPLPDDRTMPFSYILDEETFVCGGPINNGGIALQWWLRNTTQQELTDENYQHFFHQAATTPPGNNGLIFLPYLTGERAPIWDSESCGTFFGAKLEHGPAHFSRAILEGICYAMKDVLDAVQRNAAPITQINISGGIVKSNVWMQMLADITGTDLVIIQTEDASAIGAAFMALKSAGLTDKYPVLNLDGPRIIRPIQLNAAIYSKHFAIFKQLYTDLEQTMHKLHKLNARI